MTICAVPKIVRKGANTKYFKFCEPLQMCGADFRSAETFLAYDWNEIGTSLEFTMKFFYYIMIVSKNIQTAKNT